MLEEGNETKLSIPKNMQGNARMCEFEAYQVANTDIDASDLAVANNISLLLRRLLV